MGAIAGRQVQGDESFLPRERLKESEEEIKMNLYQPTHGGLASNRRLNCHLHIYIHIYSSTAQLG